MELQEAIKLIGDSRILNNNKTIWADLGCGDGLFTRALASLLSEGSTIYAIDKNASSFKIVRSHPSVIIYKLVADFIHDEMNIEKLDGILMANSLHFVNDKTSFLKRIFVHLKPASHILIIEYDMSSPNQWVPYPISFLSLQKLFSALNITGIQKIHEMSSRYNRGNIYSAIASIS